MTQRLYLMENSSHLNKIGIASNPSKRKRQLELASGLQIKIIKCWVTLDAKARTVEQYLHRLFARRRLEGEWFTNISVPVTSFIKCFKSNPRRFKLNTDKEVYRPFRTYHFTFKDKVTGEEWKVRYAPMYYPPQIDNVDFLTDDEEQLIIKTVYKHFLERSQKVAQIKSDRKKRKLIKERTRLTHIYKEE